MCLAQHSTALFFLLLLLLLVLTRIPSLDPPPPPPPPHQGGSERVRESRLGWIWKMEGGLGGMTGLDWTGLGGEGRVGGVERFDGGQSGWSLPGGSRT